MRKFMLTILVLAVIGICSILAMNAYVKHVAKEYILDSESVSVLTDSDYDCAIVLGCKVKENGRPSDMLFDRLTKGIEMYNSGAVPKLLMSGDHGQADYDEVGTMKQIAIDSGIVSKDIFMDHAGFSTYETMYRARDVFCVKKTIIVTQEYHLYRSIYIARKLGLDAYGAAADYHIYAGQLYREFREILARCKDFVQVIFMPKPTYLGDEISISGNGNMTLEKLSDEQALSAIKAYCYAQNADLEDIEKDGKYPVYWEVSSSEENEIVILFRSYTGAQIRFYIDRAIGDTSITEFVPGISSEEERTDKSFNVRDYLL